MLWTHHHHRFEDLGREVVVALPDGYADSDALYPALVCRDAQWMFGTTCDAALNLGLARLLPRVVVVGVGWTTTVTREVVHARAASYTPTHAALPPNAARSLAHPPVLGQAASFQRWLLDEALPAMHARYRIDPAQQTLLGHSLSGLFGLYTLFTCPSAFNRWLLASPSSWWDEKMIFDLEADSRQHGTTARGRVFLSAGSEEVLLGDIPMVANTQAMYERLDSVASRGLGDVYKRQPRARSDLRPAGRRDALLHDPRGGQPRLALALSLGLSPATSPRRPPPPCRA